MARSKELTPTLRAPLCELHAIKWGYRRIHNRYPRFLSQRYDILSSKSKTDKTVSRSHAKAA